MLNYAKPRLMKYYFLYPHHISNLLVKLLTQIRIAKLATVSYTVSFQISNISIHYSSFLHHIFTLR